VHPAFRNPLTAALWNGKMAVMIFFVLSGEALSAAYWQGRGRQAVLRQAIKRYPRLTLPILAACFVTWVLMSLHLVQSPQAAAVIGREAWLGPWARFQPDLLGLLRFASYDVYVGNDPDLSYNSFLWTMGVELAGSFLLFAVLLLKRPVPALVAAALLLFLARQDVACFFAGALIGHARAEGRFLRFQGWWAWLPLFAALAWFGHMQVLDSAGQRASMGCALVIVLAVRCNAPLSRFLGNGLSRTLGKLSFPIYLLQFPIFVSLTSGMILTAGPLDDPAVWRIALTTLAAVIGASVLFLPVERAAHRLSGLLVRRDPVVDPAGQIVGHMVDKG